MANFASRAFAILALVAVWLDMSAMHLCVQAEDVAVEEAPAAEAATEEAPAAEGATDEAAVAEAGTDEEKGAAFVDSARELQEKLGQLKALLDAKGEGADPGLKERLAGLENQLKGLGLDGLGGAAMGVGENKELAEFLGACVVMSMRRAGMQRPSTLGALRQLVNKKLTPAEASKTELWKMVGVCVGDFKEDEFASYKAGRIKTLPKAYVDAAKAPEAEKKVLEIEDQVWEELRRISEGLLKELVGSQGDADSQNVPSNVAYVMMIPFIVICGLMAYGFMNMQKSNNEKKDKASKKEGKKSK